MDSLKTYRDKIKDLLTEIVNFEASAEPPSDVETLLIADETRDCYLIYRLGWFQNRRVRTTAVFIRIVDGKVWLEEDWTEENVACRLIQAGIPEKDIQYGFHPPLLREPASAVV